MHAFIPARRRVAHAIAALGLSALAVGCASTKVDDRQRLVTEPIPRPGQIWVHPFAASADGVPPHSALAQEFTVHSGSQTPEQQETGRQLGESIAMELIDRIEALGMPAAMATSATAPRVNDLVIHGYLVSVDEGSAAERVAVGFGAGGSELRTVVEGFQMTPQGLRKLGGGSVQAGGGKAPGAAVGAATFIATANPAGLIVGSGMKIYGEASGKSKVEGRAKDTAEEIAKVLEGRFREEGWIQ